MSEEKATYEVGCYYCNEPDRFFVVDTDLKFRIPDVQIRFCPVCGKEIREERVRK